MSRPHLDQFENQVRLSVLFDYTNPAPLDHRRPGGNRQKQRKIGLLAPPGSCWLPGSSWPPNKKETLVCQFAAEASGGLAPGFPGFLASLALGFPSSWLPWFLASLVCLFLFRVALWQLAVDRLATFVVCERCGEPDDFYPVPGESPLGAQKST